MCLLHGNLLHIALCNHLDRKLTFGWSLPILRLTLSSKGTARLGGGCACSTARAHSVRDSAWGEKAGSLSTQLCSAATNQPSPATRAA